MGMTVRKNVWKSDSVNSIRTMIGEWKKDE